MNDERRTAVPNVARLSPDDIATRAFSSAFRGVSEPEVRGFLKRIGDEMKSAAAREQQLREQVEQLEERLRNPPPLDEQELLVALGDETAKLLRNAREAATDIREKAEATATRIRDEAQQDAERVREEAAEVLDRRIAQAEAETAALRARADEQVAADRDAADEAIAVLRAEADAYAASVRAEADASAQEQIASATTTGRSMVDEARRVRERVLADLAHRRSLLQAQIVELRSGREQLLDAYRVVKRSFLDATAALAAAEDAAAAVRPEPVDPLALEAALQADDTAAALADDVVPDALATDEPAPDEPLPDEPDAADDGGADVPQAEESNAVDASEASDVVEVVATPESDERSVSDLFARIREQSEVDSSASTAVASSDAPSQSDDAPSQSDGDEGAPAQGTEDDPQGGDDTTPELHGFDAVLAQHLSGAARRAKRVLQDEQNEVLDALRRQKGRPQADGVLVAADVQIARWSEALGESMHSAYCAGANDEQAERDGLADELVTTLLEGLRDRLRDAVDNGDPEGVADRVNARYREWRNQDLERLLEDVLVAATAAGAFDALPDGAVLRWVPSERGCCPDCDDNALETVVKGAPFPTGHTAPIAHPGCRCSVVVDA